MGTCKKPRKKYRPRISVIGVNLKKIEELKEAFRIIAIGILMKLPKGEASWYEINSVRDFINLALIGLMSRDDRPPEESKEAISFLNEASEAVAGVIKRSKKINKVICTGDELSVLREAISAMAPYFEDSFDHCPNTLITEWALMDEYLLRTGEGRDGWLYLDPKEVKKDILKVRERRAQGLYIGNYAMRRRYVQRSVNA